MAGQNFGKGEKLFVFTREICVNLFIVAFVFIASFCGVFKSINSIVEKTNIGSLNELSVHDKRFVEIVLQHWWSDAVRIGNELSGEGFSEIAESKAALLKMKSLFKYEDCMLVSETGFVFSASNAVKDVNFVSEQCAECASHFAVRYDYKSKDDVFSHEIYLLIGSEIEPFVVGSQTMKYFVIARKIDALSNVVKIGNFGGSGESAVVDNLGYFIIDGESTEKNPESNFFDFYEKNRSSRDAPVSVLRRKLAADENGAIRTSFGGKKVFVSISSIEDTTWKFMTYVPMSVFARERNIIVLIFIAFLLVCSSTLFAIVLLYLGKQREIRRAERSHQSELLDALSLAEQSSRAKTVFLNNMSYQIRTPMNAILGFSALASTHIGNEVDVKNYLGKISKSAHQLLSLINNVLDMSRIESGKMNITETKENLSEIIHTLQNSISADARAKAQSLRIDAIDVVDEDIFCDRLRLLQVLSNLLSNAIKYTKPRGSIYMRIAETSFRREGYAAYEFRIKDNGIGMSEDFQKSVFEPFSRENTVAVSALPGSGLGLAITKSFVNMMGGEISVKSTPRIGTEVVVRLEFRTVQSIERSGVEIKELSHKIALAVDRDLEMCDSLCRMLKRISLSASFSADIDGAVLFARESKQNGKPVSLVILGYDGEDSDFLDGVRKIRRNAGEDAKIVVLTALDWSEIEILARTAGVDCFVSAPLFDSDLRACLSSIFAVPSAKSPAEPTNLRGRTALLAEDNESSREITKMILNEAGIGVVAVENGEEALEILKRRGAGQFDFVLMDLIMPVLDGLSATKEIRAMSDKKLSSIPIIAMTAKTSDEDKKAAIAAGMDAYLPKPVDVAQLFELLKSVLEKNAESLW